MLKSIQELKSIGCFYDDHPAPIRFEPLTFIFGENCYGKSTLCDIFRSLSDNSPEYITDRISVPNEQNQSQTIRLSIALPENGGETQFVFNQNHWNPNLPEDLRLFVFDTDFIHRNVFTGLTIERKNKENITQFVLGEAGVRTATEIAEQNKELRRINKEKNQLADKTFKGIENVAVFLKMKVEETEEQLLEKIGKKSGELQTKKNLENNIEKAKDRNEPTSLPTPGNIDEHIEKVNTCLASTYKRAHDDASDAVGEHIRNKTQNTETTKSWLNSGLDQVAGDDCPFCGNPLEAPGKKIIEIYQACFDQAFKTYERETNTQLGLFPNQLANYRCLNIPELLQGNIANIALYPELSKTEVFKKCIRLINASAKGLKKLWDIFQEKFNEASEGLNGKIEQKKTAIYSGCQSWTCTELTTAYNNLKLSALKYNQLAEPIIGQIADFKDSLDPVTIASEITTIEIEQTELQLKKRRLDINEACVALAGLLRDATDTNNEIARLKEQLKREQTEFLDTCFEAINDLFSRLGSGPFQISRNIGERGNMPVIELTASYSGVQINQNRLKTFFSESDRRALALSIFLAKTNSLDDQQKQNAILVLDDPVTSFDDGRIDRTIRLMESYRPSYRQVIVLSHYPKYLKRFFERASLTTSGIKLSKINKSPNSSILITASPTDFIETGHQLKFRHIKEFIEHSHTEDVLQDLRIFLETEIKSRYCKQIIENDFVNLQFKDLLDNLRAIKIIDQPKRDVLEGYRLSLNPEHHTWTELSHEDRIGLASDVLDFIYLKL